MAAAGDKLDTKRICVSGGSVPRYRKQRNFLISGKSALGLRVLSHASRANGNEEERVLGVKDSKKLSLDNLKFPEQTSLGDERH